MLVLEILMQVANDKEYVSLRSRKGFHGSAPSQLYDFVQVLYSLSCGFLLFERSVTLWSPGGSCELHVEYEKRLAQHSESGDTLDSARYYL